MTRVRLIVTLAVLVVAPPLAAQTVTVAIDGVDREVPVIERQGRQFVALAEVARLLRGDVLAAGPERAVLVVDQDRMTVHRRSPFVQFDGRQAFLNFDRPCGRGAFRPCPTAAASSARRRPTSRESPPLVGWRAG
jgi:hypothetical protein